MYFCSKLTCNLRSSFTHNSVRYVASAFSTIVPTITDRLKGDVLSVSDISSSKRRRKKNTGTQLMKRPDEQTVVAFATAEEYNLSALKDELKTQNLYVLCELTSNEALYSNVSDAVHAIAKYKVTPENRHLYFFVDGAVVMWNFSPIERHAVLDLIKPYEVRPYDKKIAVEEMETMSYSYSETNKRTSIIDGVMCISKLDRSSEEISSDRYTLSNAMALSVKLGVLESILEQYIDDLEYITEDLKFGKPLRITQPGVLKKSGELFALRHSINLSMDLLDIPDFYWDRENLEALYQTSCSYFSIAKRTKVLNEKLSHCLALIELVSSHLSDRHHTRLEWMIIILIMVEVMFEILHAVQDYNNSIPD